MKQSDIDAAVEKAYGGYKPGAAKRGRNPRFPYVPIMKIPDERYGTRTEQLVPRAFATRQEAIDCAAKHIANLRTSIAIRFTSPECRALRQHYGLPRDINHPPAP